MHLKTLTMRGFKSFASTTTLEFEPGITCVIGPNGSGKSNVVDAIAWVMGEQGAKSLRGGKMDDVIFAGTSGRPPLGRAEVELVIDNSDGSLPIDFTEVRISRILFRDGGSEYSINGEPARLLDVQELLSDSGIGREMHVIVGQGRLDSVLHATPEDRRGIVEEAAGVLKHRKRKEKALRKLDAMAANLVRLRDLTGELQRQLKPLGRQAAVARRAAVVQADARDARLRLLADDYVAATREIGREEAEEAALLVRRASAEAELAAATDRRGVLEDRVSRAAPRLLAITDLHVRFTSLQERFTGMIRLANERLRHLRPNEPEQLSAFDPNHLDQQADEARAAYRLRADEAAAARTALDRSTREHSRARAEFEEAAAVAHTRRLEAEQWRDAVSGLEARIGSARSGAEARRNEVQRIEEQLETSRAALAPLQAEFERVRKRHGGDPIDESEIASNVSEADARVAESRRAVREARDEERELGRLAAAAAARLQTLRESEIVPIGMDRLSEAGVCVLGPVSGMVVVTDGWQTAIDAALAHMSEAIAISGRDAAFRAVDRLGPASGTRTAMLIADEGERARVRERQEGLPSASRWAADVIAPASGAVPEVACALAAVLDDVVLVDDLDTGRQVLEAFPQGTVVTRSGELIAEGILVIGRHGSGAMERRGLVSAVSEELVGLEESLAACRDSLRVLERRHEDFRNRAADAQARASALRSAVAERTHAERLLAARISAAEEEVGRAERSLERARDSLRQDRDQVSSAEQELARVRAAQPTPAAGDDRLAILEAAVAVARDAEFECRLAERAAEERAAAQRDRVAELESAAQAERDAIESRARQAERRRTQAETAARVVDQATMALRIVDDSLAEVRQHLRDAEAERHETDAELVRTRARVDDAAARLAELTSSYHRDEVARAKQRMRIDQLSARAMDEFGIETGALMAEYGPTVLVPPSPVAIGDDVDPAAPVPPAAPFVRSEQERRLREAEKSLALLGRVNPLALEEFAAMEERHAFLTAQVEDLKRSRKDLLDIVAEVDERVRAVFADAFADVQREFSAVFERLFPGGEGRLVLTDPDDLLTTGVDVEARPAGKRVKRLSLLSGGERSLTAMAFLVALFKARPAPFYLLDEVEAALDDHNLIRLLGMMVELRDSSQLLVITHQKRTMEIADALYGITMRGGVTQVVSQRMRELQPV